MADDTITLIPNALYGHYGRFTIAIDEYHLEDVVNPNGTKHTPTTDTELIAEWDDPEWADRMVRIRSTLLTELKNSRAEAQELRAWRSGIEEALFEQAEERNWCEEYDAFAAEWGLPLRVRAFEVTMRVIVRSRDEEGALSLVKDCVTIDRFTEGIDYDPDFQVSEE